jgi:murein DD-endopeptidase MepM/ murein hydrolase activator NlpD
MPCLVASLRPRSLSCVAALALTAFAAAGCSESARFDSNPFAAKSPPPANSEVTGSVTPRSTSTARVETQPLPAPSRPATVAAQTGPYTSGVATGATGLGTYRPGVAPPQSDVTGSVQTQPKPVVQASTQPGGWTWEGGTPVTVGRGETIETISRKYGVPSAAIMQQNGITSPAAIRPGQKLVIPRYNAAGATPGPAPVPHAVASVPAKPAPAAAKPQTTVVDVVHTVAAGENLLKISRIYGKSINEVAKANNLSPAAHVNIGDRVTVPNVRQAALVPQSSAPQIAQPRTVPAQKVVSAEPAQNARMATPAASADETKTAEPAGGLPSFRWPVRGRIIAGFGPKPNGQQNDGINLAVPEGTPVKSAEDGVVAYAGSELKGYGNLILVRHSNGFVSAYAHNSELLVKRGDNIKRGQIIARAGQTGNVTSPQLHFEIRKGSTPVDPTTYLSGA